MPASRGARTLGVIGVAHGHVISPAGRDRGASIRSRRERPRRRRRRRVRLARGADRPGRRPAWRRPARHQAGARARRRRAGAASPGEESAARHDRAAAHRRPLPRGRCRRCALATSDRGRHDAPVRRAAAGVLDQPLHRLAAEGQLARAGRRVRARRDPAEHRRPLRDAALRLDDAPGNAALPRQLAVGRAALARRLARSAPRSAARGDGAGHRHQREPGARSPRAAHARRRERARRHLHAGRRHPPSRPC